MKKKYVKIEGIHCNHCIDTITKKLSKNENIKDVKIKNDIANITYVNNIDDNELIKIITDAGYITKQAYISDNLSDLENKIKLKEFIIIISIILIIWLLINKICGINIFNIIPNIDTNITYGMLFITGLLTSIHCISMCGAINLITISDTKQNYKRPLLYNLGRVISYTLIGGIVGALGNLISINDKINGIILFITSILMILTSLSMMGIIKYKISLLNKFKIKTKSNKVFIIGLLSGLMPCGPLGAMQLYALGSGRLIKGALAMFFFSLGTVPLMLCVGIIFNLFKGKRKILINKIASILILVLSLTMLNRSLLKLNIDISRPFVNYQNFTSSIIKDNYQIIEFDLRYNNYQDIIVQKDIPVKIIIHVNQKYLTGCNNEIILRDFNITKKLEVGDNIIEFTPTKIGNYTYTCGMEMIKNNIKVIDNKNYFEVIE